LAHVHDLPPESHGVIGDTGAIEQHIQNSVTPLLRQACEYGAEPHHPKQPLQLDAVDRDVRCRAITSEGERRRIGAVHGNSKLPERRERRVARPFAELRLETMRMRGLIGDRRDAHWELRRDGDRYLGGEWLRVRYRDRFNRGAMIVDDRARASLETPIDIER